MSITIKEIAEKANVSIATVSRALNNNPNVKESTRELIKNLAQEMNYSPNFVARTLVKKKTNVIGIILPEVGGEFFPEIIKGVDEVAYQNEYHVFVASSHSERNTVESILEFMSKSMVDGVILMLPSINDQIRDLIKKINIPIVLINGYSNIEEISSVGIDNFQGAYSMTNFLINNKSIDKIAFIKGPDINSDAKLRLKGYKAALEDNNIEINEEWIIDGDFTIKGGEIAASRLLSLLNKPSAIFAANDMMAAGCYRVIESLGLKIPSDIAVVGFDHIPLSEFLNPRLTTVHVPTDEIGRKAAQLLLDTLTDGDDAIPRHIKITTGLIIGNSC